MKPHAIKFLVALIIQGFSVQATNATEELAEPPASVSSPAMAGPPDAVGLPTNEFEIPCEEISSPLTLMQWSYSNGNGEEPGESYPGKMETDRPYFTRSASVVGRSQWQLETGTSFGRESDRHRDIMSYPEALLRAGAFAEWLEFRVGGNWTEDPNSRWHGRSGDWATYVGVKIALTPQEEFLPELAMIIDVDIPSRAATTTHSLHSTEPGLSFVYHWDLPNGLAVGGATEFHRLVAYRPYLLLAQSFIVERYFTERLTGSAEWFLLSPDELFAARTENYIDAGLKYLYTDNVQLDTSTGVSLNDVGLDYFLRAGVSFHF